MASDRRESQEVIQEERIGVEEMRMTEAGRCRVKEKMKIAYTNIDGIISSKLE